MNAKERFYQQYCSDIFNLNPLPIKSNQYNNFGQKGPNSIRAKFLRHSAKYINFYGCPSKRISRTPTNKREFSPPLQKIPEKLTQKNSFIHPKEAVINDKNYEEINNELKDIYYQGKENRNKQTFDFGNDQTNYYKTTNNFKEEYVIKIIRKNRKKKHIQEQIEAQRNSLEKQQKEVIKAKTAVNSFKNSPTLNHIASRIRQLRKNNIISNIFNDPEKERMNKSFEPKRINKKAVISNLKPPKHLNHSHDNDLFPKQSMKSRKRLEGLSARERKLNDNKGHFPCKFDDYKNKILNLMEKSRDKENRKIKENKYKGIGEAQRPPSLYRIENVLTNKKFDMNSVKKIFRENGIHIYNEKMDYEFYNGGFKGVAKFTIRKNNDDNLYENKLKHIENILKRDHSINLVQDKFPKLTHKSMTPTPNSKERIPKKNEKTVKKYVLVVNGRTPTKTPTKVHKNNYPTKTDTSYIKTKATKNIYSNKLLSKKKK